MREIAVAPKRAKRQSSPPWLRRGRSAANGVVRSDENPAQRSAFYCLLTTGYCLLATTFFVFFSPSASNQYSRPCKFPSKNACPIILPCKEFEKPAPEMTRSFCRIPLTRSPFSFSGSRPLTPGPRALRAFFVFFSPSASNPYNSVCKFPGKTAIIGHSDTRRVRKNALENAFCVHVFSRPQARREHPAQRSAFYRLPATGYFAVQFSKISKVPPTAAGWFGRVRPGLKPVLCPTLSLIPYSLRASRLPVHPFNFSGRDYTRRTDCFTSDIFITNKTVREATRALRGRKRDENLRPFRRCAAS